MDAIRMKMALLTYPAYFFMIDKIKYFYKDIEGLELDFTDFCNEDILGNLGWRVFHTPDYPVYYHFNDQGALRILNDECVDCRLLGGTTTKPDFWPQ